jgi:diadenosine tetraphosphate (Ap4A) HIT family hydrolase
MYTLHPRLAADTFNLGHFPLSLLLLMNDSNFPWFILVPQRDSPRELHELDDDDRIQLLNESTLLSRALMQAFTPDKLNIAALGNQVPQLHVHHIVRYTRDPAWPAPVWGKLPARPYYSAESAKLARLLIPLLGNTFQPA